MPRLSLSTSLSLFVGCLSLYIPAIFFSQPKLLFDCVDYFTHWNINNGNSSNVVCVCVCYSESFCSWHLPHTMIDMGEDEPAKADFPYRFGNRQTISIRNDSSGYVMCFSFPFAYTDNGCSHKINNTAKALPFDSMGRVCRCMCV